MPVSRDRLRYIDIAKAIGIVLVIVGHITVTGTLGKRFIYAFHMPLFFVLSGMLLCLKSFGDIGSWSELILKRAKRLLIPYFIWAMIYSTPTYKNAALIFYGSWEALGKAQSLTSLWFLPVMFLAVCLAQAVISLLVSAVGKRRLVSLFVCLFVCLFASVLLNTKFPGGQILLVRQQHSV